MLSAGLAWIGIGGGLKVGLVGAGCLLLPLVLFAMAVVTVLLILSLMGLVPLSAKVLGGGLLIGVAVMVVFFIALRLFLLKLARTMKGALEQAGLGGGVPSTMPLEIHVQVAEAGAGFAIDAAAAERALGQFRQSGFVEAGRFRVQEFPGLLMQALVHPVDGTWGLVTEHPQVGVWSEIVVRYADGTSQTFTGGRQGHQLDHRPGHDKLYDAGAEPVRLLERCQRERKDVPVDFADAANFIVMFETAYRDEMAWRKGRGGVTAEEVRRVAAEKGMDVTDEQVNVVRRRVGPGEHAGE